MSNGSQRSKTLGPSSGPHRGYIYHTLFTRPTDGKVFHYVGQHLSSTLDRAYFGSGLWLRSLVKKYGLRGNTRVRVLSWASTQEQLDEDEVFLIAQVRRLWPNACVNLRAGSARGAHAESTKRKISKANLGRKLGPNKWKGKKRPAWVVRKNSEAHKGIPSWNKGVKGYTLAKVHCEHCDRDFSGGNYAKYHGDKCSVLTGKKHEVKAHSQKLACSKCFRLCIIANIARHEAACEC